jgi:hypothetical protein
MIEIVAFLILALLAAFALGVHFERYMERRRRKRAIEAGNKTAGVLVSSLTAAGGWGVPGQEKK